MVELGELEKHHTDFDQRNVRIISVSPDNLEDSKKTQDAFPHLQVVSDAELNMADALAVRDKKNKGEHGQETNSPTVSNLRENQKPGEVLPAGDREKHIQPQASEFHNAPCPPVFFALPATPY